MRKTRDGYDKTIKFYNLESSKYYYFGWDKTKNNTVSGDVYVHNTNWLY
jgi:hypothetical protein